MDVNNVNDNIGNLDNSDDSTIRWDDAVAIKDAARDLEEVPIPVPLPQLVQAWLALPAVLQKSCIPGRLTPSYEVLIMALSIVTLNANGYEISPSMGVGSCNSLDLLLLFQILFVCKSAIVLRTSNVRLGFGPLVTVAPLLLGQRISVAV